MFLGAFHAGFQTKLRQYARTSPPLRHRAFCGCRESVHYGRFFVAGDLRCLKCARRDRPSAPRQPDLESSVTRLYPTVEGLVTPGSTARAVRSVLSGSYAGLA